MLSRAQAIENLNAYGIPLSEEALDGDSKGNNGEFGIFAIIIRVLAGLFILGMTIVSITGFVALLGLEQQWEFVAGAIGILATGFSAWKFRHNYKTLEKQYSFKGLLYLSLLLVGKACLLAALFGWLGEDFWRTDTIWIVAVVFTAITVASCMYYRMYLEAFLAVLVSLCLLDFSLGQLLRNWLLPDGWSPYVRDLSSETILLVHSVVLSVDLISALFLAVFVAALLWFQRHRYLSSVYLYAVMLFLGYKLMPGSKFFAIIRNAESLPTNWGLSIVLLIAVVSLYAFLIGGWRKFLSIEHFIVAIGIAILAALSLHGVLFAAALMAFGRVRHDQVSWVIGMLYLPIYLFAYYYSLDATLLIKSYLLIGSGVAILLIRYALIHLVLPSLKGVTHA